MGNTCVQETQSCLNGTLNQQTGVCYCEFVGMVFITNVGCQCRDQNAYFDVASKSCTCNTNYYLFKGACTICWKNSFPANDLTTCVCKTGFVAVGMTCVAQTINCLNGTYNSQTNTCTCTIVGMYFQATVGCLCQDPNSQYDIMANACTCLPNHY